MIAFGTLELIFLAIVAFLTKVFLSEIKKHRTALNLPPGPKGLPFLGYLPYMGKEPHETFFHLSRKYGGMFGLYIGTQYFVVVDDIKYLNEAFNKDEFLDRPPGYFQILPGQQSLAELKGSSWKEFRRFYMTSLRSLGMGKTKLDPFITEEAQGVVKVLRSRGCEDVYLPDLLESPINNGIFQMLFGKSLDPDHPFGKSLYKLDSALSTKFLAQEKAVFFPWLKKILVDWNPNVWAAQKVINEVAGYAREETQRLVRVLDKEDPKSFVEHFSIKSSLEDNALYEAENLTCNLMDMLIAGSDTTRLSLSWFLMCMANFQDVQDKCYHEIVESFGQERDFHITDRTLLPYTSAAIAESMRWKTITFINLFRHCSEDGAKIGEYDIPKGTVIVHNVWSMCFNPDVWPEPELYKPERFLNGKTYKAPDFFVPFSFGKRICPGTQMAQQELLHFAVELLRNFQVVPPTDGLSFEYNSSFNKGPVKPVVRFRVRESL